MRNFGLLLISMENNQAQLAFYEWKCDNSGAIMIQLHDPAIPSGASLSSRL